MAQFPLPRHLAEAAKAVLDGKVTPVRPRDAATVMLLRPGRLAGPGGAVAAGARASAPESGTTFEVYMLRRQASMKFAPGAYVFPGGSVDPRDAEEEIAWSGPTASTWGEALAAPPELARALVCAAVRETFEESGVLLAGPDDREVVADTTGEDWERDRRSLLDRSLSLAGLLTRRGLTLRSDLLRPWSRWITPVVEPRRFDARFFAAALPQGQRTRDVGGEAAAVRWITTRAALEAGRAGEIEIWFPTMTTLTELAGHADLAAVLSARNHLGARRPEVVVEDGSLYISLPGLPEPSS